MAVPVWSAPYLFTLTTPWGDGSLVMNDQSSDDGWYLLDQKACSFNPAVRSTSQNVPQQSGSILHRRFVTGASITLAIQLWESQDKPACDSLLKHMLDKVTGSFLALLNAGDNDGRLAWEIPQDSGTSAQSQRMLDDARLLVYPKHVVTDAVDVVLVTIDSKYPYAEDLTQRTAHVADGGSVTLDNVGTSDFFPVFQVDSCPTGVFILENVTTGEKVVYSGTAIGGADYAELDSFSDTIFLNGDSTDLLDQVDIPSSLWPIMVTGANEFTISGADMDILYQPAWG